MAKKSTKEAEQALKEKLESLNRAHLILNTIDEACYEVDNNGNVVFVNRQALEWWGLVESQVIGKNIWDIFPESIDTHCFDAIQAEALNNKRYAQYEYVSAVLNKWITLSAMPTENGCIVVFREIDKIKKAEEQLKKQHNILNQAEELTQAGSWEYNVKTREFLWSDGMYSLFGIKKDEHVTPDIYVHYSLKDDLTVAKKIADAIQKNFEAIEEIIRIKFNGSYRSLKIKGAPFKNENGEVEKMLGVDMDITDAQHAQKKIVELNKSLFAMNKDLNILNSELRNFNSIAANNYAEVLRHVYINLETIVTTDARNLSNSSRANIRRAQAAVQKMKLLTNDINNYLELYDVGIRKELVNPANLIVDVKEKMQKKIEDANATINVTGLPQLFIDQKLFSKLMVNIIDNSIRFKKPDVDPVISIGYSLIAETNSDPKASENTAYTIITVSDNGIGFREGETEMIFDLFTQLEEGKHKGSGIGLAICKKIMEMHGGFISAESEPGKGTSIHCYFPREQDLQ